MDKLRSIPRQDAGFKFLREITSNLTGLININVYGEDNARLALQQPVLLAFGPHSSHLDSFVVYHVARQLGIPKIAVPAAADYWFRTTPRELFANAVMPVVELPRADDNPKTAIKGIHIMEHLLKEQYTVIVAPQGTRQPPGHEIQKREGTALVSLKTGTPIIPLSLHGAYEVLPKGSLIPHIVEYRNGRLTKPAVTVTFRAPIFPNPDRNLSPSKQREQLTEELFREMLS